MATALGIGILRERLSLPIAAGALPLLGGLVLVSIPRPRAGSRPQPPASSPPVSAEPSERPVKAGSLAANVRPSHTGTPQEHLYSYMI